MDSGLSILLISQYVQTLDYEPGIINGDGTFFLNLIAENS